MGGNTGFGNVTATAEFNFWKDPASAQSVLHAGIENLFLAHLEVTHQVYLGKNHLERLYTMGKREGKIVNKVAYALAQSMEHYLGAYYATTGKYLAAMHDPLVVYYVLEP
jgi:inosine-uridine nucleoside N-ribohydrolase